MANKNAKKIAITFNRDNTREVGDVKLYRIKGKHEHIY